MPLTAYFNGRYLPSTKVKLGIYDLGILRSYAVFDYLRTYNRIPFCLDDHLARFGNSANELNMKVPLSKKKIGQIIRKLINGARGEVGIRLVLTGGYSKDSMAPGKPNFIILTEKLPHYPAYLVRKGVKLITHEFQRILPEVKSTNYLTAIRLKPVIRRSNAFEVLYYLKNQILEVSRNNFFLVKKSILITPKENVLHGITRRIILNLASGKYHVKERRMLVSEIIDGDEAFICGSSKRIIPVVQIDNIRIGTGKPGPVTMELINRFDELTSNYGK